MFITNFLFGLIIMAAGVVMLRYNFKLTNMFSRNNVFEHYLGSGSTYLVMQVLALLAVIGGFLLMTGLLDNVAGWLFSPLTGLFGN